MANLTIKVNLYSSLDLIFFNIILPYVLEKFVTNAYKQKMAEMREQEAQEKKEEMMEEIMDVTKQKDMSGFYK